jgi:hypothetical protein
MDNCLFEIIRLLEESKAKLKPNPKISSDLTLKKEKPCMIRICNDKDPPPEPKFDLPSPV